MQHLIYGERKQPEHQVAQSALLVTHMHLTATKLVLESSEDLLSRRTPFETYSGGTDPQLCTLTTRPHFAVSARERGLS